MRVQCYLRGVAVVAAGLGLVSAHAQQWPAEKPVRMIVPFSPGGGTDIQARLLTAALQRSMGQTFIVDNRTGASGLIGTQLAVDSAPDGYTVFFTSGSISVVTTLYAKRMKFDPLADLAPVSWLSSTPLVLSVHPSVPVKTVKEFVALAKSKPGMLTAGGNATGSTAHLSAEMFNQMTGAKATVVTYRGGGPATVALISGETDFIFATAPSVMPHLRTGKAKALAVTTAKPSSFFPDLPTMNSIYPGFEADNWYAAFYPRNTPRAIIDKMNSELAKAQETPEVKKFMTREALEVVSSSP
jgi:tripartite-type tricarboxylate transporter receptor subunit TctC